MNKIAKLIYQNIVDAKIGDIVSTRHTNGKLYGQTVEDMLNQQGYKKFVDFESGYDYKTDKYYIKKLIDIKPYEEPVHNIKVGDIFYNSWGWEQTNIDFYQVVAVTKTTISIREIKGYNKEYNAHQMTGLKMPVTDSFCSDEILRKTPYLCRGEWRVSFEYGAGGQWDGKPLNFSCYA